MSDVPHGQGWWLATDGRWYPPEQHPNYTPPPVPPAETRPASGLRKPITGMATVLDPPTPVSPPTAPGAPNHTNSTLRQPWVRAVAILAVVIVIGTVVAIEHAPTWIIALTALIVLAAAAYAWWLGGRE